MTQPTPTVYLGADHGGFELKEQLKGWLVDQGYEIADCGAHELVAEDDYPDLAFTVAESVVTEVAAGHAAKGILLCRSGGGMAIAANKVLGARAVEVSTVIEAEEAVDDNQAQIITLGADNLAAVVGPDQVWATVQLIVMSFLERTSANQVRHQRRLGQISEYEMRSRPL